MGVTGGIASGKSYVSEILEELGAPLIDFDELARVVVEPGKPALKQIVAYFGKQVLADDGALDRKKLSDIVFSDMEKRKKLESFTHPAIYEEFFNRIATITAKSRTPSSRWRFRCSSNSTCSFCLINYWWCMSPRKSRWNAWPSATTSPRKRPPTSSNPSCPSTKRSALRTSSIHNEGTKEQTRKQVEKLWERISDRREWRYWKLRQGDASI